MLPSLFRDPFPSTKALGGMPCAERSGLSERGEPVSNLWQTSVFRAR